MDFKEKLGELIDAVIAGDDSTMTTTFHEYSVARMSSLVHEGEVPKGFVPFMKKSDKKDDDKDDEKDDKDDKKSDKKDDKDSKDDDKDDKKDKKDDKSDKDD